MNMGLLRTHVSPLERGAEVMGVVAGGAVGPVGVVGVVEMGAGPEPEPNSDEPDVEPDDTAAAVEPLGFEFELELWLQPTTKRATTPTNNQRDTGPPIPGASGNRAQPVPRAQLQRRPEFRPPRTGRVYRGGRLPVRVSERG
jgi:hypothetical protein